MGGYALRNHRLPAAVRRGLTAFPAALLAAAALLPAPARAELFRWVDERGNVHYGDSLPKNDAGKGHDVLDSQGRLKQHVNDAATNAQERQRREEAAARQDEERRAALERERYDNALLSTYSSPEEIDQARDRQLAQEMAVVDGLKVQLKQATDHQDIDRLDTAIFQHFKNMQDIRARYQADRTRYLELTGKPR